MSPKLMSITDFCCSMGISRSTVSRRINDGTIPVVRIGAVTRIPMWYVEELTSQPGHLPGYLKGGNDNA